MFGQEGVLEGVRGWVRRSVLIRCVRGYASKVNVPRRKRVCVRGHGMYINSRRGGVTIPA